MEISNYKEFYERQLTAMNAGKFERYLAWFNVKIKGAEAAAEREQPKLNEEDAKIKVPIVDRIKETVHRRNGASNTDAGDKTKEITEKA